MLDNLKKNVKVYIYDREENKVLTRKVDSFVFNSLFWNYNHVLTTDDEKTYIVDPLKTSQYNVYETDGGQYLISTEPVDLSLELLMEKDVLIEQMEKYDYAIDSLRKI